MVLRRGPAVRRAVVHLRGNRDLEVSPCSLQGYTSRQQPGWPSRIVGSAAWTCDKCRDVSVLRGGVEEHSPQRRSDAKDTIASSGKWRLTLGPDRQQGQRSAHYTHSGCMSTCATRQTSPSANYPLLALRVAARPPCASPGTVLIDYLI